MEAFDRITKNRNNVNAIVVSDVPQEIKAKYSKNKKISIYGLMPHSKIMEDIFPYADIFVYPGYSDTFGFVFVEALSLGIPIVTVDGSSRKYIVNDGKTGFVVKRPKNFKLDNIDKNEEQIINELVSKTNFLLKNEKIRKKMSQNCIQIVKNGKFSIKERNKKLERIYQEAIE